MTPLFSILFIVYAGMLLVSPTLYPVYQDEARYWSLMGLELPEMLNWLSGEVYPPLYFLMLKAWSALFGRSGGVLRIPSMIFALGAFVVFFRLLKTFLPGKRVVTCLVLFALLPFGLFSFRLAKYFSLLVFLFLLSTHEFLEIAESDKKTGKHKILYVLYSVLMIYTHYLGILGLFAHAASFLITSGGRKYFRKIFPAHAAAAILFAPWIVIFLSQAGEVSGMAPAEFSHSVKAGSLRTAYLFYAFLFGNSVEPWHFIIAGTGALLMALGFVGNIFILKNKPGNAYPMIFCIFVTGIFLGIIASIILFPYLHFLFLPERLIFLLPLFAVLLGCGLYEMKILRYPAFVVLGGLLLFSVYNYYSRSETTIWAYRIEWRDIKSRISKSGANIIIFDNYNLGMLGEYYLERDFDVISAWNREESEYSLDSEEMNHLRNFWFIRTTNDSSPGEAMNELEKILDEKFGVEKELQFLKENPGLEKLKSRIRGEASPTRKFKLKALHYREEY